MSNQIKTVDEYWHIASDWCRAYQLKEGVDISNARAVCKFRDDMDNILAVADCHIQDNVIIVEVLGRTNSKVYQFVRQSCGVCLALIAFMANLKACERET